MVHDITDQLYWREHPVEFIKTFFKIDIAYHQKKMLEAVVKYNKVSVVSANGIGKSKILSALIIWFFYSYLSTDKNTNVIVLFTAPNFGQVKDNIYNNIKNFIYEANETISEFLEENPKLKPLFGDNIDNYFLGRVSQNQNSAEIRFNNTSYMQGVSSDGPNKIVGKHGSYVLVVFDEAQGIDEAIYSDFNGILMSGKVRKQVMIGNSTIPAGGTGKFHNSFKENSDFHNIKISCFDTPNFINPNIKLEDYFVDEKHSSYWRNKLDRYASEVLKEKISYWAYKKEDNLAKWEELILESLGNWGQYLINPISVYGILQECGFDPNSYEFLTRCLAEFPTTQSGSLFPSDFINSSIGKYKDLDFWIRGEINMGVDVATGSGNDKSAITIVDGNKVIYCEKFDLKPLELKQKIKDLYYEYGVQNIRLEKDGVGSTLFELLIADGLSATGIFMGGGAGENLSSDIYLNPFIDKTEQLELKKMFRYKRNELWWKFRDQMNPERDKMPKSLGKPQILIPDMKELKEELHAYTNERGKIIEIISKEKLKKKIQRSSDIADSVLLAFADLESSGFAIGGTPVLRTFSTNVNRNIY